MSDAPAAPLPPARRRAALVAGGLLTIVALAQFGAELVRDGRPRSEISAAVPAAVAGLAIALEEDAPAPGNYASVALRIGTQRYAASDRVWRDADAPGRDWLTRYDGRFRVAGDAASGDVVIVEMLRERNSAARAAWRGWSVSAAGDVSTWHNELPAREAERQVETELFGVVPRRASIWPPVAGLTLGLFCLLSALLPRPPPGWPAVGLVCVAAALASAAAWPVMLNIGLARSLPGVLIGVFVTAGVAALSGRRAQRALTRGRATGYAAGAAFAAALFLVFVNVYITIGGFVAPVLRVPGESHSPMDLLVQDYVAPAIALTVTGLLPALLAGVAFAWWCRRG